MIYNDQVLFIHVPKTAGMSLTHYLADNLPGEVYNVAPEAARQGPATRMKHVKGPRHADLPKAREVLAGQGRSLEDFKLILSVVRCPYDLEVSRYHYLRQGHPWDKGLAQDIAMTADFKEFCKRAPFQGRNPALIERFYCEEDRLPRNARVLRFEGLSVGLPLALRDVCEERKPLRKVNVSKRRPYGEYFDSETENYAYEKYKWLFDMGYYSRESF
ncbi:MAG: hypothetical protein HYZ20_11420 [Burkholderiales bacterium]|nr:hypothetical protein [Burkholderiales bacterium]